MAFLNPTVNAYRRIAARLAGADARQLGLGQPHDVHPHPARARRARRGSRSASATAAANPYLAIAALLLGRPARRARRARAAAAGRRRRLPRRADASAGRCPPALDEALDALEADAVMRDAIGPEIVDTFLAIKRFEVERHRAWVSDWEIDEYLHHL